MNTIGITRAHVLGILDGWRNPDHLESGMTWEDDHGENESYDAGVNRGQAARRIVTDVRRFVFAVEGGAK